MTNDHERRNSPYFVITLNASALKANCLKLVKDRPMLSRWKWAQRI